MTGKKVAFVVAYEGFQQVEFHEPKNLLEKAHVTVVTVSTKPGAAIAKDGSTTPVQLLLHSVNMDNFDGIFFIGGPGALEDLDNETSYQIIQDAVKKRKIIGAICISPRILANAGVLKEKQATGWNGDNELAEFYRKHEVTFINEPVVVDELVVTASGPSAAQQFGEAIISMLISQNGWG